MNTRHAYWRDLADVSLYLRADRKSDVDTATMADIKAYLDHLSNKKHVKGKNTSQIAVHRTVRGD